MSNKKKFKKQSIARIMFEEAKSFFAKYPNNVTRSAYVKNYRKFIDYCRREFDCKTTDECKEHIADYVDYLVQKELTPSTIHTYIAPVAIYHGIPMEQIQKPRRCAAHNVRSRSNNGRQYRSDNDENNPKYARSVDFQKCVGIRRNELVNLRGNDYTQDENGNFFVCKRTLRCHMEVKCQKLSCNMQESFVVSVK